MENSKDVYAHNCHAGASALCMKQRMFIHTKKSYERKNRQGGIEMQFDFDRITDRRNTGSLKWDAAEAELPMWVADMDFQTAPAVLDALRYKIQSGIFGYSIVTEEWYQSIISWWNRRHGFRMQKKWLIFCTGVVPAVTCAVKRMTNVGDNVVVQTPVYDIFFPFH